tara:strand:- start:587 stop:1939 length:1353 start_codon:yes stop_codon:yes gene_type:complete
MLGQDILDMVNQGKTHAIMDLPLLSGDVLKMNIILTTARPTASTDGTTVWMNPHFVASLTPEQIEFLIVHEWAHCFLRHFSRGLDLPMDKIRRRAEDEEVNYFITVAGFKMIPGGWLTPEFKGMTLEEIDGLLRARQEDEPDEPGEKGDEPDNGNPGEDKGSKPDDNDNAEEDDDAEGPVVKGVPEEPTAINPNDEITVPEDYVVPPVNEWGGVESGDGLTESEKQEIRDRENMEQANSIAVASLSGNMPAALEEMLRKINKECQVDWREELSDFIDYSVNGDGDLTFAKPNKKFIASGVWMPSIDPECVAEIAVMVDSSGSMDEDMYQLAYSETQGLINFAEPDKTWVIEFDHKVSSVEEYEGGMEFKEVTSRSRWGGTNPLTGFKWIQENSPNVTGIVVISDMEFHEQMTAKHDPGVPVLWVEVPSNGHWWPTPRDFGRSIRVRPTFK